MTVDVTASATVDSVMAVGHLAERALIEREANHIAAIARLSECRPVLMRAAELLTRTLGAGNTVFTLGNGGSAAEAQHFAAELVGRFLRERRAFPVQALTTDSSILTAVGNDYCFEDIFARQVEAFARPGDLLVAFSTSGESENAVRAARAARSRRATIISLTGERDSSLGRLADIVVQAPSSDTPTVQELHSIFTHILCDVVETYLCAGEGVTPA